ncbi:uracil-DNA glycosylase family protein [Oceanomicrobium pacificus]|uniref:Uracil-DNA glycosylase family protein n=1 Tax=Oceanomicrobium pacificus TaxID=2692916 RepID=A0A6B0TUM4_9RHOB|nr:uracil-DNA glycosylase family protein [Oceanomicrobium pacificus]MXU64653.1 uracil-DNA glycosylase family protein [Oceanomicrobium pacificus]
MQGDLDHFEAEISRCRICADRFAATRTAHVPRPVTRLSDRAPILIAGQAPGARVHNSGLPFDDRSGDRLRDWLGVDRATFYDRDAFAILPMGFCFPGYSASGSDLPPPKICAATWRDRALDLMPQIRLTLLVGGYAQGWHMAGDRRSVTDRVAGWRANWPARVPLPHPSWRNTGWLKRHPWFEAELVPALRDRVATLLRTPDRG